MIILVFLVIALQINLNYANEDVLDRPRGLKVNPTIIPQFNQEKKYVERTAVMKTYSALGNQDTCSNACDATGGIYDPNRSCQCDLLCYGVGDCCADYSQYCATDVPAGYIVIANYLDDQCMEFANSFYIKNEACIPFSDDNGNYNYNGKFVSFIGHAPFVYFYSSEDVGCKGTIISNSTYGEGCRYGSQSASITKSRYQEEASQYTGFAYLAYDSKEKAKNPNYLIASYVVTYYYYCADRSYMGVTYSKVPECVDTGNSYVMTYFLGSGCSSTYHISSHGKKVMYEPFPIIGGYYLDTLCFAAADKSPMKYLKTVQTPQAINEKKDLISEVKYNSRPTKF